MSTDVSLLGRLEPCYVIWSTEDPRALVCLTMGMGLAHLIGSRKRTGKISLLIMRSPTKNSTMQKIITDRKIYCARLIRDRCCEITRLTIKSMTP